MPAFDPVRDAVLNSPIASTSQPPFLTRYSNRTNSPTNVSPNESKFPYAGPDSPSGGRRATDLSVLLNAEPQEPQTPVRSASLSHLLLPNDVDDNKLANVGSIRRNSKPDTKTEESHFTQRPSSSHARPSQPKTPLSQSFDAGTFSNHVVTVSPPSRSPVVSTSRPSSSSSSSRRTSHSQGSSTTAMPRATTSPTMHVLLQPKPPTIPYKPHQRRTPADSVLRPITPEEIISYRDNYSIGTRRLKKRKRARSSEPDEIDQPPVKKLVGDVGVVVEHCE